MRADDLRSPAHGLPKTSRIHTEAGERHLAM
jgi:hypothetical protein